MGWLANSFDTVHPFGMVHERIVNTYLSKYFYTFVNKLLIMKLLKNPYFYIPVIIIVVLFILFFPLFPKPNKCPGFLNKVGVIEYLRCVFSTEKPYILPPSNI